MHWYVFGSGLKAMSKFQYKVLVNKPATVDN